MSISNKKTGFLLTIFACTLVIGNLIAQDILDTLDTELPLDNRLVIGKLSNGFTYYIVKDTHTPKIICNLVVKAGSNQEKDDQIELAHLLEHLPFVETKHFKNPRSYFIQSGLKYGFDINAQTGSDNTRYFVQFPQDNDSLFESTLLYLRDCAQDIVLSQENIDKERGVILGELRRSTSHTSDMRDHYLKYVLPINGFAERTYPVRKDYINKFEVESLRRFFNKWYGAENEMLLIIGDIDVKSVEDKIRKLFSDLLPSKAPIIRSNDPAAQFNPGRQIVFTTHKEMNGYEVQVHMKLPHTIVKTFRDLQASLIQDMYNEVMSNRFILYDKKTKGCMLHSSFRRTFEEIGPRFSEIATVWKCTARDEDLFENFKFMTTELQRVKVFGFTSSEISSARKAVSERLLRASRSIDLRAISDQYVENFVSGAAAPGSDFLFKSYSNLLSTLSDDIINETVKKWFDTPYTDIIIMSSTTKADSLPCREQFEDWLDQLPKQNIDHPSDLNQTKSILPLSESLTQKEKYSIEDLNSVGVKRIRFSNGITILLKNIPTADPNQITLLGVAPGGSSIFHDSDFINTTYAPGAVTESGVGNLNGDDLNVFLARNNVFLLPFIGRHDAGFYATFPPASVSAAMQAVYGYMRLPKMDEMVFNRIVNNYRSEVGPSRKTIGALKYFTDTINRAINIRADPESLMRNKQNLDLTQALSNYRSIFSNTNNFTFIVVGNYDENILLPEVAKYLTILPKNGTKTSSSWKMPSPNYGIRRTFYYGSITDKAAVQIKIFGRYPYSALNSAKLELLESILQMQLTKKLRIDLGDTYDVSIHLDDSKLDGGFYDFSVMFECAPDRTKSLAEFALDEIGKIWDARFIGDALISAKETRLNVLKNQLDDPDFWSRYFKKQILYEGDLNDVNLFYPMIRSIDKKAILEFSQKYISERNISVFQLLPAGYKPTQ